MAESKSKSDDKDITARLIDRVKNLSTTQKQLLLQELSTGQETKKEELRKHPRKKAAVVSDYVVGDRVFKDFIQNISAGGVFIETASCFSIGQSITLTFTFPEYKEPIKITGKIARSNSQGIGVKFSEIDKDLERLLKSS